MMRGAWLRTSGLSDFPGTSTDDPESLEPGTELDTLRVVDKLQAAAPESGTTTVVLPASRMMGQRTTPGLRTELARRRRGR